MRTAFVCVCVAVAVPLLAFTARAEDQRPIRTASVTGQVEGSGPKIVNPGNEAVVARQGATATTGGIVQVSLALAVAKDLALPAPPPPITLTVKVDLANQRVSVLERGKVKYTWAISSGRAGYATQTGTFQPQWTAKMWYSRQWDMAPMPHAIFFNQGTAFHATSAVGMLGRPASHGCIRLAPAHAAQLYALVHRHGLPSTKVIVHGAPRDPAIARRKGGEQARTRERGSYQEAYARNGYQTRPRAQRGYRGSSAWGF